MMTKKKEKSKKTRYSKNPRKSKNSLSVKQTKDSKNEIYQKDGQLRPEIIALINKIGKEHTPKGKKFGYLTQDDMMGEVWLICLDRLKEYNPSRGKLEHYLRFVVHNRIINKFKDITKTIISPCPKCPFFDPVSEFSKGSPSDCAKFGHERERCKKFVSYLKAVESRNALLNPTEARMDQNDNSGENFVGEFKDRDFAEYLIERLSEDSGMAIRDILNGYRVGSARIKKLQKEILENPDIQMEFMNISDNFANLPNLIQLTISAQQSKNEEESDE